jgi:hypothetical protein
MIPVTMNRHLPRYLKKSVMPWKRIISWIITTHPIGVDLVAIGAGK